MNKKRTRGGWQPNKTFIYFYLNQIEWPQGNKQRSRKTRPGSRQVSENFLPQKRQEGGEKLTICSRSVTMEIRACVEEKPTTLGLPGFLVPSNFFLWPVEPPSKSKNQRKATRDGGSLQFFNNKDTRHKSWISRVFAGSSGRLSSFHLSGTKKKAEKSTAGDQAVGA